ncbi:MAG: radical SAM protein [Deltaproteobacteria bacterium]|nr:radical SAM protein [Deltaproteobacteria bacterium]
MSIRHADAAWLNRELTRWLHRRRHPLTATFELCWRCNFRCIHCYLRGQPEPEALELGEVCALLDELAQAGCLALSLTGGEPLVREDFDAILRAAVQRGFLVSVFTNASLVDAARAARWAATPPRMIEVSLYGASPASYELITGSAAAFERTLAGIDRLLEQGLVVSLKAMLQRDLAAEVDAMRALAAERGLGLRIDPGLDPTLDGDPAPTELRIPAAQAARIELADPERVERMRAYHARWQAADASLRESPCGAGYHSFHLDPAGRLMPCLLLREPALDTRSLGFAQAWRELGRCARPAFAPGSACAGCMLQHLCSHCPGLARLGCGPDDEGQPYYHCELAQHRASVLG